MKRTLGELETEIMRRLWLRGAPTTVRELVDELQRDREIAYTTVMTVLDNLFKKRWLRREMDGRAYRYEPRSSGEEYSAALMRGALDTSPDHVAAFAHFLRELPPDQVRALEDAYEQETGRRLKPPARGDRST
ncbi:MAG: BlaI/MecI/CopY family transcriptional regulator [Solirubrobacteraceae bacterium]